MLNVLHSILARYFRGQEFHFAVKFVYFKTCSAQNLVLFFLFWLSYPGDCGTNFVLGDQLCFSWFSVKVPISCCTPATLADASLFTTRPTMGLFYLRSVKSTWQGDHPGTRPTLELGKDEVTTTTTTIGNKTRRLLMNEAATFVFTTSWRRCKAEI